MNPRTRGRQRHLRLVAGGATDAPPAAGHGGERCRTGSSLPCPRQQHHRCDAAPGEHHQGRQHRRACGYRWRTDTCLACRTLDDTALMDTLPLDDDVHAWVCADEAACTTRAQALLPRQPR